MPFLEVKSIPYDQRFIDRDARFFQSVDSH